MLDNTTLRLNSAMDVIADRSLARCTEKPTGAVNGMHSGQKLAQKKFLNYILEDFDISTVIGKQFYISSASFPFVFEEF